MPADKPKPKLRVQMVWAPQPGPQYALVKCPLPEIFFGGARGGGKTDGVLGKYLLKADRYRAGFNALFCRRELPMLDDAIERSKAIYGPMGATWSEQHKTWRFRHGGRLRFRPLERLEDADKYQGQNLSDACIEEAGQYPDSRPIDRLHAVLRSAHGVPTQMILTGNPGGAGQGWIKARYIDPAPRGWKVHVRKIPLPAWAGGGIVDRRYVFIPSRVSDNRFLGRDYVAGLHLVGSEQLVKAWLEGDWNAVEGAFFDEWSMERHVIKPFPIPNHWTRFVSMDWGYAAPFSVHWWAVVTDHFMAGNVLLPRGCIVAYREWYGLGGARLSAEQIASGILDREVRAGEVRGIEEQQKHAGLAAIAYGVLDPSCWANSGGPPIAEQMARAGVLFRPADNRRVARLGAISGWDQMRARLKGDVQGRPMLVFFSSCIDAIRTIPVLQHDPDNAEDLDTEAEDHAADDVRYACMSRPYVRESPEVRERKMLGVGPHNTVTLNDLWAEQKKAAGGRI